jgi:hypothetical protein
MALYQFRKSGFVSVQGTLDKGRIRRAGVGIYGLEKGHMSSPNSLAQFMIQDPLEPPHASRMIHMDQSSQSIDTPSR